MPALKRFKITFRTVRGKKLSYTVCTPLEVGRAATLALKAHRELVPGDKARELLGLENLPGAVAENGDIIDSGE